ncbi:MAG: sigma-70 family RNA polymerase sigma factor [Chloroflexi bacterium]|nr:sigma-70 family RNA polymerase sigma factor [Chloroflexota bacterium]MCC6894445.1 sigma-70 family RNA polymerase sigma factor [Anaerolineae bacterium]
MTFPDEQQMVIEARRDPAAFRALYQRYLPRVYAYVAYRVGREADAEDLTADIFIKVVEGLAGFEDRGEGAFAAWVFRIAHNHVSQFYRQQGQLAVSFDELPDIASESPTPETLYQRQEQFNRLRQRIANLSPRRQEIVTLRFFGELRNNEIAEVLGLDERTVAAHLCRAIEDLQRQYEPEIDRKQNELEP